VGAVAPTTAIDVVAAHLSAAGSLSEQGSERLVELMVRFARFATTGHGLGDLRRCDRALVDEFVTAPTSLGTSPSATVMHLRRCAVRLLFRVAREMGLVDTDPTMDLTLPERPDTAARPLLDDEVALCRAVSMHRLDETRLPAAWALAEAGIRTGELAEVTVADVDVDAGRVWASGSRSSAARWVELDDWGATQVARRLRRLDRDPARPVVYTGSGSAKSRQAASCIAISVTLARAGLGDDPNVRPISVTAWTGRRILERTGGIEDVRSYLGMHSLDRAARLIGMERH
jgi:integrase/recombinase XerC